MQEGTAVGEIQCTCPKESKHLQFVGASEHLGALMDRDDHHGHQRKDFSLESSSTLKLDL